MCFDYERIPNRTFHLRRVMHFERRRYNFLTYFLVSPLSYPESITASSLFNGARTAPLFGSPSSQGKEPGTSMFSKSGLLANKMPSFDNSSVRGATVQSIFSQPSQDSTPIFGASKIPRESDSTETKPEFGSKLMRAHPIQSPDAASGFLPVLHICEKAPYPPIPAKSPLRRSTPFPPIPHYFDAPFATVSNRQPTFSSPPNQASDSETKVRHNIEIDREVPPALYLLTLKCCRLRLNPIQVFKRTAYAKKTEGNPQPIFRGQSDTLPAWNFSSPEANLSNQTTLLFSENRPWKTGSNTGGFPFTFGADENDNPFKPHGKTPDSVCCKPLSQPIKKHKFSSSPASRRLRKKKGQGGGKKRNSTGASVRSETSNLKQTPARKLKNEIRRRRVAEQDCEAKARTIRQQNALLKAQNHQIQELQAELKKATEVNHGNQKKAANLVISSSQRCDSDERKAIKSNQCARIPLECNKEPRINKPKSRKSALSVEFAEKEIYSSKNQETPRRSVPIRKGCLQYKQTRQSHPMKRRSMTPTQSAKK